MRDGDKPTSGGATSVATGVATGGDATSGVPSGARRAVRDERRADGTIRGCVAVRWQQPWRAERAVGARGVAAGNAGGSLAAELPSAAVWRPLDGRQRAGWWPPAGPQLTHVF